MKNLIFKNSDNFPILGLGTWKSAAGDVYGAVREAIKMGYRHIDCAPLYMNEPEIGLAIKDAISDGDVTREELWITSKLWNNAHGKENVVPALKKTLADLQLKYIDLWLIHWPVALKPGISFPRFPSDYRSLEEVPITNTWEGMEMAVEQGLTRHIGVSNFSIKKITEILSKCEIKPEVNQVELHPLLQQKKLVEFCKNEGIVMTAYSPLGSKDRSPSMKSEEEQDMMKNPVIVQIAEKHNCSPAQILLAWHVNNGIAVIPKSVNQQRLLENLKAADVVLLKDDMSAIAELDKNFRFVNGKFWAMPGCPYTYNNLWDEE
ncbi:MAG: aldo/keto reductase [Bacteroidales bacterium]